MRYRQIWGCGLIETHLKHGGLIGCMFSQLSHLIHLNFCGLLLFALRPALSFVSLFLQPGLLFLAFGKR